jgi:hypothetical protein
MPITSSEFCHWLAAFVDGRNTGSLTIAQTRAIRQRLSDVFRHEIDPMMGDEVHQASLNKIHSGSPFLQSER